MVGCHSIGIIKFSSSARVTQDLISISSEAVKDTIITSIPQTSGGGTCIRCGLAAAMQVCMMHDINVDAWIPGRGVRAPQLFFNREDKNAFSCIIWVYFFHFLQRFSIDYFKCPQPTKRELDLQFFSSFFSKTNSISPIITNRTEYVIQLVYDLPANKFSIFSQP